MGRTQVVQTSDFRLLDIPVPGPASNATKAKQAIGIVFIVGVACLLAFRGAEWWLIAVLACLVAVRVVVIDWLEDEAVKPSLTSVLIRPIFSLVVGVTVYASLNMARLSEGKIDVKELITIFKFVVAALAAYEIFVLYQWRKASRTKAAAEADGSAEAMDRISVPGALFHFAGYVVGFAAAVASISFVTDWLDRGLLFGISFLIGKLIVDALAPTYRSLAQAPLSQSLLRMAAISPLWWGLPWAIVVGVGSTLAANASTNLVLQFLYDVALQSVVPLIAVVTSGFCLLALAGVVIDALSGSHGGQAPPGASLSATDWLRLFLGVFILNFVLLLALYRPEPRLGRDLYGEERWTCAESYGEFAVGWIAKAGVHITVHDNHVHLFNLSCVPRANGRGCDYDDAGWETLEFEFHRKDGSKTLSFARGQEDVKSKFLHHADLVFGASMDVVTEMLRSRDFKLTISAPKERVLYAINADLAPFSREYGKCVTQWREEAARAQ